MVIVRKVLIMYTLLSIFNQYTFSQTTNYITYYNNIEQAYQKGIFENNFEIALKYFQEAFNYGDPFIPDLYYCAIGLINTNAKRKSINFLTEAIQKGLDTTFIFSKNEFKNKLNRTDKILLIETYNEYKKPMYNQILKKIIDSMVYLDRQCRNVSNEELKEGGYIVQDSLNCIELEKVIKKFGWPGQKQIGSKISFVLLLHADINFVNKNKELLVEEMKKGNLEPYFYAAKIDDYYYHIDSALKYGSYFPFPITESCEKVKNRYEIGALSYKVLMFRAKIKKRK